MQGARLSHAQRAFDDMNEDSIDKKVITWYIHLVFIYLLYVKVGEIVRYLLCADRKKLPVKKKGLIVW